MKKLLRIVGFGVGLPIALFLGAVLFLGRPSAREPRFLRRLHYSMWTEALGLLGYGLWHPHLLSPGTSPAEKKMPLPGDQLVPGANHSATYGITIDGSAEQIWPWLIQMGEGRASWYCWSPVHVFPEFRDRVSPDYIDPRWQQLRVGDVLLDGDVANNSSEHRGAWRVREIQDRRAIVFFSARTFVEGFEFDPEAARPSGPYGVTSWTFCIQPIDARRSRLLIRVRAEVGPRWMLPVVYLVFGNYDRVFERTILEGIKYRVEHCAGNRPPVTDSAPSGNLST